ncbi:MAG TPA: hypothetical protein VN451_10410 [Chitinophagaceae bacterium]|nr:hypothetical protein [Chitinophagaceae bacterium]
MYLPPMDMQSIAGEYQLQAVHEMASAFLLKPEGDFQFFFSYGALDRYGSGKWILQNDVLILNSAEKPEHDFELIESKTIPGDQITVRITDRNSTLLRYVYASLQKEETASWQPANNEGLAEFPKQEIKDISLMFEFCQEKTSTFIDIDKQHNHFTFRFKPWFAEVFIKNFVLKSEKDGLTGGHPLLNGNQFLYARL